MFAFWAVGAFPLLPNHGIYIYYVEHTYPQTGKINWLAIVGTYLNKTFPVSYMFDSKNKIVRPENMTYFISLRKNEKQVTRFIAIGNAKNL